MPGDETPPVPSPALDYQRAKMSAFSPLVRREMIKETIFLGFLCIACLGLTVVISLVAWEKGNPAGVLAVLLCFGLAILTGYWGWKRIRAVHRGY